MTDLKDYLDVLLSRTSGYVCVYVLQYGINCEVTANKAQNTEGGIVFEAN